MNAQEAFEKTKIALENIDQEYKTIISTIDNCARNGSYSLKLDYKILDGTKERLKKDGYDITFTIKYRDEDDYLPADDNVTEIRWFIVDKTVLAYFESLDNGIDPSKFARECEGDEYR